MSKLNWATRACSIFLLWAAAAVALPAQTFTTLHSFDGYHGANPSAGIAQGIDGLLYGTTAEGGADGGYGTVFKITPSGTLTTLHSFYGADGADPIAGLVQATNGKFYGATASGGTNICSSGCGTLFKITPSGTLTTLYSFCSQGGGCTDGVGPSALVQATSGKFYGTTANGGGKGDCYFGCGTLFTITPSGTLTTLYTFCSQIDKEMCTDGAVPSALVQATNRDFYGTTEGGGASSACSNGCGTVFKITPSGTLTTLYSFCSQTNCTDGSLPSAGLVQGTAGNLYGTTLSGGANSDGTKYRAK